MTIGERIKKLRIEHNMTQEELGEKIGAIKQTVHKYENGTITNIPVERIEAIAKVFGVTEAYIMGWEDKKPEHPSAMFKRKGLQVLFSVAKDLDDEALSFLNDMANYMRKDD